MKSSDIIRLRLNNQQLMNPSYTKPADLVKWMGAVQAQDYTGAKWAVACRLKKPVENEIELAIDKGEILRTHVLRPTWHFVVPEDIRWMIGLTEPRISSFCAKYFRDLGLDKPVLKRSNKIIVKALQSGKHLTRKEMAEALEKIGIATDGLRLTYLLFRAELDQLICSGAKSGKQATYALIDQRAPQAKILKHDEALAELAQRYFSSRGPATVKDFTWWSGLGPADARKAVEFVKSQFDSDEISGETYFFSASSIPKKPKKSSVYLLPSWDEYTVAYKDRSAVIDPSHESKSGHGIFNPNIIANGQIKGSWRRIPKNDKIVLALNYFAPASKAMQKSVAKIAKGYAKFFGKKLGV